MKTRLRLSPGGIVSVSCRVVPERRAITTGDTGGRFRLVLAVLAKQGVDMARYSNTWAARGI